MSQEGSSRDIVGREKLWQFRGLRSVHDGEAALSPSEQRIERTGGNFAPPQPLDLFL